MKEFILKRPLCFICLLFTGIIFFLLSKEGLPEPVFPVTEGKETCIIGRIADKEIKNNSQVLYLKQVSFPDLEIIQSNIIENPTRESVQKDTEKNKAEESSIKDFETYDIGIICYLSEEEDVNNYPIGAKVQIIGKVQFFSKATNPGEFDLQRYYRIQGYYFKLKNGIVTGKSMKYQKWKNGLWEIKKRFGLIYESILNDSDASVLKAMVLGDKTGLDSEIKNLYQTSGIAHILAISGLHISILGTGVYKLLKKCKIPKLVAAGITLFLLLNYAVMTGGGTSTIRAVVMFVYSIGAELLHRTNDPPTSLALSAFLVTIVSPYYLFSSGFWLSYMAVAGITMFVPAFLWRENSGHKSKIQKFGKNMLDSFFSGLGLSYFTLPVILYHFYEYPLYSVLLNLFVVPLMTVLILFAICALLSGCFWTSAGIVLAYPCHYILGFYEWLCKKVQTLPNSTLILGRPEMWKIIGFYMITGSIMVWINHRRTDNRKECLICTLIQRLYKQYLSNLQSSRYLISHNRLIQRLHEQYLSCLHEDYRSIRSMRNKQNKHDTRFFSWQRLREFHENPMVFILTKLLFMVLAILLVSVKLPSDLSITLLDVGQGDGICIEDTYGAVYMIDGGSSSKSSLAKYQLLPFLKYCGVSKIDYWILTHEDMDHISGILELLEMGKESGIQIGTILLPDVKMDEEQWQDIKELAEAEKIPLIMIHEGQTIQNQDFAIICLSPENGLNTEEKNETSVVCEIRYQNFSMLCTGDATLKNEENLIQKELGQIGEAKKNGQGDEKENGQSEEAEGRLIDAKKNSQGDGKEIWQSAEENIIRVLKVAHHGSNTSSGEACLNWYDPQIALISCGKNNRYGHPHQEVLKRLEEHGTEIYRTDEYGAIELRVKKGEVKISLYEGK